jgi:hypothetical protein
VSLFAWRYTRGDGKACNISSLKAESGDRKITTKELAVVLNRMLRAVSHRILKSAASMSLFDATALQVKHNGVASNYF